MTKVQNAWKNMRIDYQIRYARMCRKVKENEFNTDNHGALMKMSYVLIEVFGLTSKQVDEVERNNGFTDEDMEVDQKYVFHRKGDNGNMVVENFAFETQSNTCYDGDINLGRAVVFMNQNHHVAKIDFIYMVDKNDNWSFHYENGTCLTDEERTELENWFITCG